MGRGCNKGAFNIIFNPHIHAAYLANDPESDEPVTITCLNPRNGHSHTGWSQSPGGDGGRPLDTSPAKYTVDENRLTINYINGTDEGLYRCVYGNFGAVKNTCIYVYGKFFKR